MKHLLLVTLLAIVTFIASAQTIPQYTGYVNDYANLFSPATKVALAQKISDYQKQSSIEIAIVTLNDLQGTYIEDYCMKLATAWGVGKKETNNGLVMFISTDKHARGFRIEVGYGLEGRMTDYEAGSITSNTVQTYFKHSKFDEGIVYALDRVLTVLGPETQAQYQAYKEQQKKENEAAQHELFMWLGIIVIFLCVAGGITVLLVWAYRSYQRRKKKEEERKELETQVIQKNKDFETELNKWLRSGVVNSTFSNGPDVKVRIQAALQKNSCYKITDESIDHLHLVSEDIDALQAAVEKITDKLSEDVKLAALITKSAGKFADAEKALERLIEKNQKIADDINANNPKSVWTQTHPEVVPSVAFASAREYLKKSLAFYEDAKDAVKQNKLHNAEVAWKSALLYMQKSENAASYPSALKKEIDDARKKVLSMQSQIDTLEKRANKSVQREHVNATTKTMLDKVPSLKSAVQKSMPDKLFDWFIALVAMTALFEYLQRINDTADSNVQAYEDAVRRKKEEEEEEERKRRRRREEEEESSRSSYSSSSSSWGGSSGGSDFGGFGGGSFGGGGATSSW